MSKRVCLAVGKIDNILADINWLNAHQISILRSVYQEKLHEDVTDSYLKDGKTIDDLSIDELKEIANKLKEFHEALSRKDRDKLSERMYNPITALDQLESVFSPMEKDNRIGLVADKFTEAVDDLQKEFPNMSRTELIKGTYDEDGKFIGGPAEIFKRVGDKIRDKRNYYKLAKSQPNGDGKVSKKECLRRYRQYALTLQNLGSLVVLANSTIRETEGFVVANKMHFAVPESVEDYDEYGLSFEFNPEEELRESYQIHKDNINPFTSVAAPVRRLLGTIRDFADIASPQYYDDLGNAKRGNVSRMHIHLMELFRGVTSQQDILNRLEKCDENEYPYKKALQKAFKENPLLLTQFYCDFSKSVQLYAKMAWGKDGLFMFLLNKKSKKALRKAIIAKIKNREFLQTANTIYRHNTSGGIYINDDRVTEALNSLLGNPINPNDLSQGRDSSTGLLARSYFDADGNEITAEQYEAALKDDTILDEVKADYTSRYAWQVKDLDNKGNRELLYKNLKLATEYFGMYFDVTSFASIVSNVDRLEAFLDNLSQLSYALGEVQRRKVSDFYQAIDITTGNDSNAPLLKDALGNLYMQIASQEEIDAVLPRATYMGKGYFSYVQSSQMSNFENAIRNCFTSSQMLSKGEAMSIVDAYLNHSKRFTDPITGEYTPGFIREIKSGKKRISKDELTLKLTLLDKFGYSSFFYNKGEDTFNVQWLKDMYFGKTSKKNAFARIFSVFRLLGDDNRKFEDFAEQSQLTSNLTGFFSNPNKGFGYFPTFILGDSGVQKFIQAPVYKEGVILKGLVDAALRDIELYGEIVAQKKLLEDKFEVYYAGLDENDIPKEPALRDAHYKAIKAKFLGSYNKISTKNIFALVPMLNDESLSSNSKIKELIVRLNKATTEEEAQAIKFELYSSDIKALLEDDIRTQLLSGFRSFIQNIKADGMLDERTKAGSKNETEYANPIIRKIASKYSNADQCGTIASSIYKKDDNNLYNNLWDYYLNHKFATINQVELFVESPAFFKQGLDGVSVDFQKRYKMVHTNGTRLAPDAKWAYGRHKGELFSKDFHRTVVYVSDPYTDTKETDPGFYNALEEYDRINGLTGKDALAPKYTIGKDGKGGVKAADGQSWVTYDCYMATMGMAGKMDQEFTAMHEKIEDTRAAIKVWQHENPFTEADETRLNELIQERIDKLKNGETWKETSEYRELLERKNGINKELSERLEECRVALMPIKSFISSFENIPNNQDGHNMLPVQIKHSECVVFPELLPKGSKLREIMEWAETKDANGNPNADMISSSESVKVGLFGAAEVHGCKEPGSITKSLNGAYRHKISNTGYIIQQNNSDHINQERAVGTQGRKIVMANMDMDGDYSRYLGSIDDFVLNGEVISNDIPGSSKTGFTGKAINQLYVALNASNILEDLNSFKAKMSDADKLRENLIQAASSSERGISESILGLAPSKEVDEDGNSKHPFTIPLFEGGNAADNAAYILSIFRKQVNHQVMAGGSAIQASAFGINDYAETDNLHFQVDPYNSANILYAESEIPWDLHYTDANGDVVELDRDEYCYGNGELIPSNKVIKFGEPNYEKYLSWKLDKNDPQSPVVVPLIEVEFPGILDLIVSRIPTEEKYSMMPLKVTRFSRKVAGGGIIRLPLHTVTIAGFDFD